MNYLYLLLFIMLTGSIAAQNLVFQTPATSRGLSSQARQFIQQELAKPYVLSVEVLQLTNTTDFSRAQEVSLQIDNERFIATTIRYIYREHGDFSWIGSFKDSSAITLNSFDQKIAAKFYLGEIPCTLLPLEDDLHVLLKQDLSYYDAHCGNEDLLSHNPKKQAPPKFEGIPQNRMSNDDDCNQRVLIMMTNQAQAEIPAGMTMVQFGQIAIDEANTAYALSAINFQLEMAGIFSTTYQESNAFLCPASQAQDLVNLQAGNAPLDTALIQRAFLQADVVILLRRDSFNYTRCSGTTGTLFGQAWHVATFSDLPAASKGFAFLTTDGIINGRFTFAHEIGHLQGGRHDNHTAAPASARGFLSSTATNAWRTIMTRTGAATCNQTNSCRIQYFSNPNVTWNNNPVGTTTRNNVARMNALADTIANYRTTPDDLIVIDQEFPAGAYVNHLGKNTIETTLDVVAKPNSRCSFRAGDRIELKPGFIAESGSRVQIYIQTDACENQPEILRLSARQIEPVAEEEEIELIED